ncbi:DUF4145 domain-containing protein [Ilumatobacter sp.]|uniref:DUF4145 domain-containing protein n=1 Tax=Ilumatobacter sp. TaxID=1967498 RepID=UPI0037514DC3
MGEEVWQCEHCRGTTVELLTFHDGHPDGAIGQVAPDVIRQVVPDQSPREFDPSVPIAIRSLFSEASIAESEGAFRAAAVMYRAAVEQLCEDRNSSGKNLYDRIEDLQSQDVEEGIVTDLHEAGLLGNYSIHEGLTFSAEEVDDVAELIIEAVHALYVELARRKEMRDARKARRTKERPTNT